MELSKYQVAVCDHLRRRAGNAAVVAVAGAGKTFVALEGIGHMPRFYQVLLGAFNKDIQTDFQAKGRAKGIRNCRYATYNGFGWSVALQAMPSSLPILDEEKVANTLELKVMRPRTEADERRFQRVKGTISRLVHLFRHYDLHSVGEVQGRYAELVDHHNIELPDDEAFDELLLRTFEECVSDTTTFDFTDQVFMPVHLGLNVPCFDQVIVDELQDSSALELRLMTSAARGGQFCGIGDPDQSIYSFKGADPERFASYIRDFRATELPLSVCYRCGSRIVEEARTIVPRIEAAPGAPRGSVDTVQRELFEREHREGDFVLCRVTEHLVRACLADIRAGRKAKVRGRDFGNDCVRLLEQVAAGDLTMAADLLVTRLLEHRIKQADVLRRFRRESAIIRLDDRVNTLRALAEGCGTAADVAARIQTVFCDDRDRHSGVDYLSIHRSKGLQAERVWVLRPDLLPHPRSLEREWMVAEERRLKYVAITRAERELRWVLRAPGER